MVACGRRDLGTPNGDPAASTLHTAIFRTHRHGNAHLSASERRRAATLENPPVRRSGRDE